MISLILRYLKKFGNAILASLASLFRGLKISDCELKFGIELSYLGVASLSDELEKSISSASSALFCSSFIIVSLVMVIFVIYVFKTLAAEKKFDFLVCSAFRLVKGLFSKKNTLNC
jgi:hypothetical protein